MEITVSEDQDSDVQYEMYLKGVEMESFQFFSQWPRQTQLVIAQLN